MTNLRFLELQNFIREKAPNAVEAKEIVSLALGLYIGSSLVLPVAEVDSPSVYFNSQLTFDLNKVYGQFNESIIVTCDKVADAAKGIWLARYAMTFMDLSKVDFVASENAGFFERLLGFERYAKPTLLTSFKANDVLILRLAGMIKKAMQPDIQRQFLIT